MRYRIFGGLLLVWLVMIGVGNAQTPPVRNPTGAQFTSPDHATVTGYEIDIIRVADNSLVQTITIAKSATTVLATGEISVTLNVQPIAFGEYRCVARAVAGTMKSDNSTPSDIWNRVPGPPSKPVMK